MLDLFSINIIFIIERLLDISISIVDDTALHCAVSLRLSCRTVESTMPTFCSLKNEVQTVEKVGCLEPHDFLKKLSFVDF